MSDESGPTPPVYIQKYNRFVDTILDRVNKVLRSGYDPVNVRLHTVDKDKNKKPGNKKKNANKKSKGKKNKNKKKNNKRKTEAREIARAIVEAIQESTEQTILTTEDVETTTLAAVQNSTVKILTKADLVRKDSSDATTVKSRANTKTKKKNNTKKNKKPAKENTDDKPPRAKATMYGLSTLRRVDDVSVNMMSSHNTVKCKFSIGPLILRVEKEFGRGAKKEIRSATATTTEMFGKMILRVVHGGGATLHSMRVLQPLQMRVESIDDHDKTREFVWRKSSTIAQIVSQKLKKATRGLLDQNGAIKQEKTKSKPKPSSNLFLSVFS